MEKLRGRESRRRGCRAFVHVARGIVARRCRGLGEPMIQGLILHSSAIRGSWGQHFLPLEEFIDKSAALGYDGVMLMAKRPHLSVLDSEPDVKDRLRARLEERGQQLACIAGYTNFTADLSMAIFRASRDADPATCRTGAHCAGAGRQNWSRVHGVREPHATPHASGR